MNILITGAWKAGASYISAIEQMGHSVVYMKDESSSLPCSYSWPECVICNGLFIHHEISKFTSLRYIQLTSVGFDRVPMGYVSSHEITVKNAGDVYSIPMAEYVLTGVLFLYKKLQFFIANQGNHIWEKNRDLIELNGKSVLIVGMGNVGIECAKRFKAFGCKVVGVATSERDSDYCEKIVQSASLDAELPNADIVVLALPLNDSTRHLMNKNRLALLKSSSILVNVSRGGIVDEKALIECLINRSISGAVLDVFEEEPLDENSPLWALDNVLVTPHNSFVGEGNDERLSRLILDNLNG